MEVFLNKKTQTLLNIGIIFLIVSMIGISTITAETQHINALQVKSGMTPADMDTNDKCIEYTSKTVNKRYGSIYCQVWLFESIHPKRAIQIADLTVNSRNGTVLDGGYNLWPFYDLINNTHITSTLKFQKNNQGISCISPQNEKISVGKAEPMTFTIDRSGGIAWAVNYLEFVQLQADYTNSVASWKFKAHQTLNGGYIY